MGTTIIPTEQSQLTRAEINRKQKEFIFPSVSTYYSDPLPMDHASMQHVWDVEGKKYLDFFGGIVTISVGHCNPRVTSRTKEQIRELYSRLRVGKTGPIGMPATALFSP